MGALSLLACFLTAVAIALSAIGIGLPILRLLDSGRTIGGVMRLATALFVGFIPMHFAVWVVGAFRYDRTSQTILLFVVLAIGVFGLRGAPLTLREWIARTVRIATRNTLTSIGIAILSCLVVLHLLGGLAPPSDYDGLNYHLSLPKFDLERGYIRPGDANSFGYLPPLTGMLYRLALAVAGAEAAQVLNGLTVIAVAAALGSYAQAKGCSPGTSMLAAIMYLGVRAILFQSGTTSVEIMLGGYTLLALAAFERWFASRDWSLGVVFGLLIGGAISVKYHGLALAIAFTPILAWAIWRGMPLPRVAVGPAVALAVVLPFTIRNLVETGDPLFPLFLFTEYQQTWGRGYDVVSLVRAPWDIFIYGARYFDGHQLGTPYLLALAPCALASSEARSKIVAPLVVAAGYFVLWFFLLSQQVRFLLPVFPFVCFFAAVGAAEIWRSVRGSRLAFGAASAGIAVLTAGQAMYLAGQTLVRAPVVLGLIDRTTYLAKVPTIQGSHFAPCTFISQRLEQDESYVWKVALRSFYCPQARQTRLHATMTSRELATAIEAHRIRFIAIEAVKEFRDNPEGVTYRREMDVKNMVGQALAAALEVTEPVFADEFVRVYDGKSVSDALR